jgi:RNA polymerase sigma factor (sigma-70 family)
MSWTTIPQLLEQVRNPDDAAAWDRFVQQYRPLLSRYVRGKGLADADAEDVVQDVLIRLLRVMTKLEPDPQTGMPRPVFTYNSERGRFRTWLYKLTSNALHEFWRKRPPEASPLLLDPAKPDATWDANYQQEILSVALAQVKTQTQDKSWTCFEEFVLNDRKGNDIAREVGLTPNAVRVNASRVMEKVRSLCAEYLAEEDRGNESMP